MTLERPRRTSASYAPRVSKRRARAVRPPAPRSSLQMARQRRWLRIDGFLLDTEMGFDRGMDVPPPRVHGIVARDAPLGVLFRRGPTRWVEVISVDLANDHVERGAWFHGRIYE